MVTMKNCFFWPGIHRREKELSILFEMLQRKCKVETIFFKSAYDAVYEKDEHIYDYILREIKNLKIYFDIWIGLSYGAALLWYMLPLIPVDLRPRVIFLINPFSNRRCLAEYKKFQYNPMWNINPEEYFPPCGIMCNLIISTNDSHIPLQFKQGIISRFQQLNAKISYLDASHAFNTVNEQQLLFKTICQEIDFSDLI